MTDLTQLMGRFCCNFLVRATKWTFCRSSSCHLCLPSHNDETQMYRSVDYPSDNASSSCLHSPSGDWRGGDGRDE